MNINDAIATMDLEINTLDKRIDELVEERGIIKNVLHKQLMQDAVKLSKDILWHLVVERNYEVASVRFKIMDGAPKVNEYMLGEYDTEWPSRESVNKICFLLPRFHILVVKLCPARVKTKS